MKLIEWLNVKITNPKAPFTFIDWVSTNILHGAKQFFLSLSILSNISLHLLRKLVMSVSERLMKSFDWFIKWIYLCQKKNHKAPMGFKFCTEKNLFSGNWFFFIIIKVYVTLIKSFDLFSEGIYVFLKKKNHDLHVGKMTQVSNSVL